MDNRMANIYKRWLCEESLGAFHSTKNSGMKFRVFHVTNGTVFSGWFEPSRPSPSRTNFRAKIRNKQGNQKMADSLSILLALELLDDYEVEMMQSIGRGRRHNAVQCG